MDNRVYWIWLQRAFGEGSPKPFQLYKRIPGGVRGFYEGGPSLWNTMEIISDKEARSLFTFSLEEAEALLQYCLKVGWQVLTPECEKYPEALRNIFDPPAVLYVKGTLPQVDYVPAIGVVGSRRPCEEAENAAKGIGYQLAAGGAVVVSGGALGVDRASLMGALSGMGAVISVLPTSLSSSYIIDNAPLRDAIVRQGGALLTEFALQDGVQAGTFQIRNRIISGLSCGVLIIQAKKKSGTMITAKFAKEQNRDVFVFPKPSGASGFDGSEGLIEDGAKPVTTGEEILEDYALRFKEIVPPKIVNLFDDVPIRGSGLSAVADSGLKREATAPVLNECIAEAPRKSPAQKSPATPEGLHVLQALSERPLSLEELQEKTGLLPACLTGTLLDLEMDGFVTRLAGKKYQRKG